jgi:hypothetical protein
MNTKLLALLASFLPAVSLASDWDVVAHVTQVKAGDTPSQIYFAIDQNAGSCAAGSWLLFTGYTAGDGLTGATVRPGQLVNPLVAQTQSTTLLADTELVEGSLAKTYTLSVTPGTLTVNVSDVGWPVALGSLTTSLTSTSQVFGEVSGSGTITYQVPAGVTTLFVDVIAQATGSLDLGLFSVNAQLTTPSSVVKAIRAGLLVSQQSGNQVEVTGNNTGCTASFVHLLNH